MPSGLAAGAMSAAQYPTGGGPPSSAPGLLLPVGGAPTQGPQLVMTSSRSTTFTERSCVISPQQGAICGGAVVAGIANKAIPRANDRYFIVNSGSCGQTGGRKTCNLGMHPYVCKAKLLCHCREKPEIHAD